MNNATDPMDHVAEASQLGWPPGVVRQTVTVGTRTFSYAHAVKDDRDETIAWQYVSDDGHRLTVYND